MDVIRSWSIPIGVMAVAILALDALLRLADASASVYFGAIAGFAVICGCYIGHRVVHEDDPQLDEHAGQRAHKPLP
jgi:hypothetical protein